MKRIPLFFVAIIISTIIVNARFFEKGVPNNKIKLFQSLTAPHFPGKPAAFSQYLSNNLKYPDTSKTGGIVILSFEVEIDGKLSDFKVVQSLGKNFDAEALRVLKNSPNWVPAMRDGKPVKSKYTQPIQFYIMNN